MEKAGCDDPLADASPQKASLWYGIRPEGSGSLAVSLNAAVVALPPRCSAARLAANRGSSVGRVTVTDSASEGLPSSTMP